MVVRVGMTKENKTRGREEGEEDCLCPQIYWLVVAVPYLRSS